METALTTAGIACLIAAIIGGGFKLAGFDFPVISSPLRQALLALLGLIFLLVVYKPDPLPSGNFRPCNKGTWNVIVESLGQDGDEALTRVEEMRKQHPTFQFEVIPTIAADQVSNARYAIVLGHGLPKEQAADLVSAARLAHLGSAGAYMAQHQQNANCTHLARQ